jgi:glycosidase
MHWDDYPDSVPYSEGQAFLLDRVKKLGQLRQKHPALWRGTRSKVHVDNDTYVYSKTDGGEILIIALNRSDELRAVKGLPASGTDLLTGQEVLGPSVNLPPRSSMVVLPK